MNLEAQIQATVGSFELDLQLTVASGELVAVLGPNGAGKTSVLRALAGLTPATDHGVLIPNPFTLGTSFGLAFCVAIMGIVVSFREIVKELPILRRERSIGLSLSAYLASKLVVYVPFVVVQAFVFTVIAVLRQHGPEDANFFQQVYFHKLGADAKEDSYVIGKDLPRIAEIQLHTSDDGRWLVAAVANGDRGQFAHYLMDAAGHWTQLTRSTTELSQRKWDPMILSIFFRAKTLRAGRFCDYRYPNWNSRRRRSSLPRVLAPVLTRAAARRCRHGQFDAHCTVRNFTDKIQRRRSGA